MLWVFQIDVIFRLFCTSPVCDLLAHFFKEVSAFHFTNFDRDVSVSHLERVVLHHAQIEVRKLEYSGIDGPELGVGVHLFLVRRINHRFVIFAAVEITVIRRLLTVCWGVNLKFIISPSLVILIIPSTVHERIALKLEPSSLVKQLLRDRELASDFHLIDSMDIHQVWAGHPTFHIGSHLKGVLEFQLALGETACPFERSSLLRFFLLAESGFFLVLFVFFPLNLIFFVLPHHIHTDLVLDGVEVAIIKIIRGARDDLVRLNGWDQGLIFLLLVGGGFSERTGCEVFGLLGGVLFSLANGG